MEPRTCMKHCESISLNELLSFWLGLKTRTGSISNLAEMEVGERVIVAGQRKGTIRFAGNTQFAPGIKPSSSHILISGCVGACWLFLYKPLSMISFVLENCIVSHCRSFCIHDCHLRQQLCQFAFIITLSHFYQSMLGILNISLLILLVHLEISNLKCLVLIEILMNSLINISNI